MATDISNLRTQRPELHQQVEYKKTPDYYSHKAYEDQLAILVCQIKIWKAEGIDWFKIPKADSNECLTIRECESIEITDSVKDLINKAVLRFPRGTIINKSSMPDKEVKSGNAENLTETTTSFDKATNSGDVIIPGSTQYSDDGKSTTSIAANYDDKGMIDYQRSKEDVALLSPHDVAIGNRIEIRLGYAYSESEFNQLNTADNGKDSVLDVVFTGFITSISVDTPLELECTNMAHVLATVSTPNISAGSTVTVKDFLDENGKYNLLDGTGLQLADECKGCDISVFGGSISDNLTIADVLEKWNDNGIMSMMDLQKDGSVRLRVGLSCFTDSNGTDLPNNDKKYLTYNGGVNTVKLIQFDWDVAQDKLSLKHNDKKYLAVEASGWCVDNDHSKDKIKWIKVTVRKSPDSDDDGWLDSEGDFQIVRSRDVKGKKHIKHKDGTTSDKLIQGHLKDAVDLSKYTVIHYHSTTVNITKPQLIEEAKRFWEKASPNGISGAIEIFGDLYIKPMEIVGLIDLRQPEKNGYYVVESVNTTFGMNGYRRELTLPMKLSSYPQSVQIIQ